MSLPNPNFQPGDLFTADNANGIINGILARLEAVSFDSLGQTGQQTLFTYTVPSDKDQILQLNSYLAITTADGQVTVNLFFTDIYNTPHDLDLNDGNIVAFYPANSTNIKAKRGTDVTLVIGVTGNAVYDCGGNLVIIKSIS